MWTLTTSRAKVVTVNIGFGEQVCDVYPFLSRF